MKHRWIVAILIVYFALATTYNVIVPPFEAPDEVWHYLYVKHWADGGSLPVYSDGATFPMRQEASQPPLFYLLAGRATAWINTDDADQLVQYNPHAAVGTAVPWGDRNMVAHTSREVYPYKGTALAVHWVRLLCTLAGACTVLCTYAIAKRLFPSRPWLAITAAAINAFIPQFVFIHSSVSNDALVTLFSALTLWQLIRLRDLGPSASRLLCLGLTLGLAALTKLSGLLLLPLTALVLLALIWRRYSWQIAVAHSIRTFVPTAVVAGWWYVRNWVLYRDPFGLELMFAVMTPRTQRPSFGEMLHQFKGVFDSFWGVFGWFNIPMEPGVYKYLALVTVLGLLGVLSMMSGRARASRSGVVENASAARPSVFAGDGARAVGLLALWVVAYVLGSAGYIQVLSSQGRLLFPAMSAIAILLPLGLAHLLPGRHGRAAAAVFALSLICLSLVAPSRYIAPAYARSPSLTVAQRVAIPSDQTLSATFGDEVRLVGYEVSDDVVRGGTRLWVTLYWEALGTPVKNYSVFVHLVDDRGVILAQHDSWPGAGNDPTSRWLSGDLRKDSHPLDIPESLLAVGPCAIHIGLYDYASGQRLTAVQQDRPVGDWIALPQGLSLERRDSQEFREVRYEFDRQIALTGYSVQPIVARPGQNMQITLRWEALSAGREDYTVFVQLLREGDQIWGQLDHIPRNGQSPTSLWSPGQVVNETFELCVREDAPEDRYQLVVGLYSTSTFARLRMQDGTDAVTLGQIAVRP